MDNKTTLVTSTLHFLTKTGSTRRIPVHELILRIVSERKFAEPIASLVFGIGTNVPFSQGYVSHRVKKCMRIAEVDHRQKFDLPTHIFAAWLVQIGVSIYEVQKLLGHKKVKVPQVYAQLHQMSSIATSKLSRFDEFGLCAFSELEMCPIKSLKDSLRD